MRISKEYKDAMLEMLREAKETNDQKLFVWVALSVPILIANIRELEEHVADLKRELQAALERI